MFILLIIIGWSILQHGLLYSAAHNQAPLTAILFVSGLLTWTAGTFIHWIVNDTKYEKTPILYTWLKVIGYTPVEAKILNDEKKFNIFFRYSVYRQVRLIEKTIANEVIMKKLTRDVEQLEKQANNPYPFSTHTK